MAKLDPAILEHIEWLGFVQPTGLVVSAPALVRAGAILNRRDAEGQTLLRSCIKEHEFDQKEGPVPYLPDFKNFASTVLGWSFSAKGYAGTGESPIPSELELALPDYNETLRPDFAVRELDPKEGFVPWQLIVRTLEPGANLDKVPSDKGKLEASHHGRMERLLRQTRVPAGLLFNGLVLRLISAPRGESSGWLDFRVAEMIQTAGRPISTALRLLLRQHRLLSLPQNKRLTALLEDSRKFQNEVSERLAEQVLHGLYELLRGLQSAHDASKGELLHHQMAEHPDEVYRAMLTVILRLVFLLYSEERGMLPDDEAFIRYYSLSGLYERLRGDAALYPDTMNQRYGAWAQLVVLFRMIYDGAECGAMRLPKRHGVLFDPDRYPFLEGRKDAGSVQSNERIEPPLIPDGTIYRVLDKLLVLDGERISYRALDVEQIGSVYETMMGFRLETAKGRSIAIKAAKKHGAPSTIDIEALLEQEPKKRKKWVKDRTDRKLTAKVNKAVKDAATLEDLLVALDAVLDKEATPDLVPQGAMILQPSEERRRSGSHYTPRSLTKPIVRRTLEPILARLRKTGDGTGEYPPTPEQILELKVCDPAMGSGAFLVEACRQLGDALIESWHAHDCVPELPVDEDEDIFSRRLVAQRCLYGVDRNPVAVDLAKVSLWLVTLAREHSLTFLDHALCHGDSLVGLTNCQIAARDWSCAEPINSPKYRVLKAETEKVSEFRRKIRKAGDKVSDSELRGLLDEAVHSASRIRSYGDLVVEAFFKGSKDRERKEALAKAWNVISSGDMSRVRPCLDELRHADPPLAPLHWELEFPEVFERENPGFDAMVGNPPFAGKNTIISGNRKGYLNWLKTLHEKAHGNADIVAHFFRRAFTLLRSNGNFGLIATKTIGQGDTRDTGLRWICENGGEIWAARRRIKWPGQASRIISIVHLIKGQYTGIKKIDNVRVDFISAFLFHRGGHRNPELLKNNSGISFQGCIPLGMGFTFDDSDKNGIANPTAAMEEIIKSDPRNGEMIFPFIGYSEVADSPTHSPHRFIINFGCADEAQARQFPDLMDLLERKVKPGRLTQKDENAKRNWWLFLRPRPELQRAKEPLNRAIVTGSQAMAHFGFAFLPTDYVYSSNLSVLTIETYASFCVIQCRVHELWARFFMSTMKDDLAYTTTTCFETFPFPADWQNSPTLEAAGQAYYKFRARLMVQEDEGLTKTYNRFHDPEESAPDILKLRKLHAAMDRAVLDAYGWDDIPTDCEFLLDYEIDEENWSPRKRKPYRYRWPESVHDEILARLLELNEERAEEESLQGELFI